MTVLESRPGTSARSPYQLELRVDRADISFWDVNQNTVRISITVQNIGECDSPATSMRLESAPLGAFVSWRPLTRLLVPSLEPGEARVLSIDVQRPHPTPLGDFNHVPPQKLLTAISPDDQPLPSRGSGIADMLNLILNRRTARRDRIGLTLPSLALDLQDLLGNSQPYWAGNINVFVGSRAVERHFAKALRVYPGRTNLAMFVVGGRGMRDFYSFELKGLAPDWKAALFDIAGHRNLQVGSSDIAIPEREWVPFDGARLVMLAAVPPAGCNTGNLQVHVSQRSSSKTAVVEFDLDPRAQGTGCYSM